MENSKPTKVSPSRVEDIPEKIKDLTEAVRAEYERLADAKAKPVVFTRINLMQISAALDTLDRCMDRSLLTKTTI